MIGIPAQPKIYHITHVDNLAKIAEDGFIWSDSKRIKRGLDCSLIGMPEIKRRRLEDLEVSCHAGTKVGQYVPFYFCPRSIMLYILHMGNHPDLAYRQGQWPIVHLQADLMGVVEWAKQQGVRWAFSDRNAGAYVANFYRCVRDLDQINWEAVRSADFRDMEVKEGKQAEFLCYEAFPWSLVEKIGVVNSKKARQVSEIIRVNKHQPIVQVKPSWYF